MPENLELSRWRVPEGGETDLHGPRVRAHPLFAKAARALAANSLAAGDSGKALAGIMKDAGRYVAAMWAIYLHVSGGLTLPRLKEICAASGFLSPGRARAMLFYMRYLGYVVPAERKRGEPQRYVPTAEFRESWRDHLRWAMQAACIVEPAAQIVLNRLDDDGVFERIARFQAEGLLSLARVRNRETIHIRVFMHRLSGNQVIFTLLTSGSGDAFPPDGPIPFSITIAAQRFGVSRIHIRRMLNDAMREGFFSLASDGVVVMSETACEELRDSYGMQIAQLLASAAAALPETTAAGVHRQARVLAAAS